MDRDGEIKRMEKIVFCTLFDSNYLDKGLVMMDSLEMVCSNYLIYVLPMDRKVSEVIKTIEHPRIVLTDFDNFLEYESLESIFFERSYGEFCWTCASSLIEYVLNYYQEKICTYIDADLFFYRDPRVLINEMRDKSVQIIAHRFTNDLPDRIGEMRSGRFCVQFNTFKNNYRAKELLKWWIGKCRESCSCNSTNEVFGDQKYLDEWANNDEVSIISNLGGGIAPWNVKQYFIEDINTLVLKEKKTTTTFPLIFYHFHNIKYLTKNIVRINIFYSFRVNHNYREIIYYPYLKKLEKKKRWLYTNFDIYPHVEKHPGFENASSNYKRFSWDKFVSGVYLNSMAQRITISIRKNEDTIDIRRIL